MWGYASSTKETPEPLETEVRTLPIVLLIDDDCQRDRVKGIGSVSYLGQQIIDG